MKKILFHNQKNKFKSQHDKKTIKMYSIGLYVKVLQINQFL